MEKIERLIEVPSIGVMLDNVLKRIDNIDFQTMLNISNQMQHLLEMAEEDGVQKSHIIIFSGFLHLIHNLYVNEDAKKVVEQFIKIPKKKKEKFFDQKTREWIIVQLAKVFYKSSMSLNDISEEFRHPTVKSYHIMAMRIIEYYDLLDKEGTTFDVHDDMLKSKMYHSTAKFILSLLITHPDELFKYLEKIKEMNLINNLNYYLNDEINRQSLLLLRYGKNKSLVDFSEDVLVMADETINENLENIKSERDEYLKLMVDYEKQISDLRKKSNELQIENSLLRGKPVLTKLKVLVIGDTQRKEGYKKVVEKHGGIYSFLDGVEEATKSKQEAMKNDIIFHITDYGFHVVSRQLDGFKNIQFVNTAGLQSLENSILKLKEPN